MLITIFYARPSLSGPVMATRDDGAWVLLWDLITGTQLAAIAQPASTRAITITPRGEIIVGCGSTIIASAPL